MSEVNSKLNGRNIIVVPCYNEARRLATETFYEFTEENPNYDFLFVNDGSKDHTLDVLNELKSRCPARFHIVDNEKNLGKGNSIRAGILRASELNYSIIGYLDADLATPLHEARRLIEILKNEDKFILILGSRVDKILGSNIKRSRLRWIFSRVLSIVFYFVTRINAYDTQCGAKFFRNEISEIIARDRFYTRWLFDIEILFRIQNSQYSLYENCREFPIFYWRDVGDSKLSLFDFVLIFRELKMILKKYRNKQN